MSPDRSPIINHAKEAEGFITIAGLSGHGFMIAPRLANLLANYLTGEHDNLDINLFSAERYIKGELLLEPAVV
jgi:sarcosine oxidase subunit beta